MRRALYVALVAVLVATVAGTLLAMFSAGNAPPPGTRLAGPLPLSAADAHAIDAAVLGLAVSGVLVAAGALLRERFAEIGESFVLGGMLLAANVVVTVWGAKDTVLTVEALGVALVVAVVAGILVIGRRSAGG